MRMAPRSKNIFPSVAWTSGYSILSESMSDGRNRRMSHLRSLASELLVDDRFFSIYAGLEQEFGRERLEQFLDRVEGATAALDDEALADLRSRVASDNCLLAEEYHLDLKRYGYALAATSAGPAWVKGVSPASEASSSRIDQLFTVIETERQAKASQISEIQKTFAGEREAAITRIRELEAMLKAEHNGFVARIRELEASLDGERRAQANQIVEMQKEREAAIARIHELEAMLKAEHNAFVALIRELEQKGLKPTLRRVVTQILRAVSKRGEEDSNLR